MTQSICTSYCKKIGFSFILLVMAGVVVADSNKRILPPPKKISPHVYAWIGPHGGPSPENRGFRMNMAFVVGDKAVAVLETGFYQAMAEDMIKHIRAVTDAPIRYAINSNSQPDRFFGNDAFHAAGATLLAHPDEIRRMDENAFLYTMLVEQSLELDKGSISGPKAPVKPVVKKTELDLGGIKIIIESHKAAHTPSPLIVSIPADNVVYAGDILYGGRLLAIVSGGSIKEWIQTFDFLRQYKNAVFIPGHGKPGKLSDFEKSTYQYLNLLYDHMTNMYQSNVGLQEAVNKLDQSAFSYLENYEDLAGRNANRAYLEVEQELF